MKKHKNTILILVGLALVLSTIFYYRNHLEPKTVRDHYQKQEKLTDGFFKAKTNSVSRKHLKENEKLKLVEKNSNDASRKEFNDLMSRLNSVERKLKQRQKICAQVINEILPNDDYIDINDEMYDEVELVVEAFTQVVNGAMFRPEAMSGYSIIRTLVEEEFPVDPFIIHKRMERLDVCRDPKALNFIDTIFEAYQHKKWPKNVRDKLINEVVNLFNGSIEGNKSIENLLYFNNLFLIMADNGVVPNSVTEDLEELGRRMNENHILFKEGFGPTQTRETNLRAIGDYLRSNDEFAEELNQQISDIYEQLEIR